MSIKNFIPEIWSAAIFKAYDETFIFKSLTNRDYEGDIRQFGDQVKINEIGSPTISDYNPDSTSDITYEKLTSAQKTLVIDRAKSWSIAMDDVDDAQTKPKLITEGARKAGVALSDVVDTDLAGLYVDAGLSVGSTSDIQLINSGNFLELIGNISQEMNEANVPSAGRWIVAPPWFMNKWTLADTNTNQTNDGIIRNGWVGRVYGFDLFMSNNVNADSTNYWNIMAGNNDAITLAEQLVETEAIRREGRFEDALRGLLVYGRKVVRPNALVNVVAAPTTEV